MNKTFFPAPPNPTMDDDADWTSFDRYLDSNSIRPVEDAALEAYQHAAQCRFLCARDVNHCLTLEAAGDAYGNHGEAGYTPADVYGPLDDFEDPDGGDFECTKSALDQLFVTHGIRLASETVLYKGINSADIYGYLKLGRVAEGDEVNFFGYLSTTVCRENAVRFAKAGILLVLSRVDRIPTLVPPNVRVRNAPTGDVPEQEVLLNRGYRFRVKKVVPEELDPGAGSLRVVHFEAQDCPAS